MSRLWPQSLRGQMLLALALALLLAQTISAVLIYRAQAERREEALIHGIAFRLFADARRGIGPPDAPEDRPPPEDGPHPWRPIHVALFASQAGDVRQDEMEQGLRALLAGQDVSPANVIIVRRAVADDPETRDHLARHAESFPRPAHPRHAMPDQVLVAAVQLAPAGEWLVAREIVQVGAPRLIATLVAQTLLIYAVLVGAMALILNRASRPLAMLTSRVEHFARTRDPGAPLPPAGPQDLRRLIAAHNAMESRVLALLDEKDVMLGAIGHDLKTPLAALRVRIECVEDGGERARMAGTIDDIARSLDDILSLARVGRPSDPLEQAELAALVTSVVEEFEDMGEQVELGEVRRTVLPLRSTWLKRALRNLIGNAVRYGRVARVSLAKEGGWAVIRIEDEGPGIPEDQISAMMEAFRRGDPSRNSETGGAGLGLTLARAIADQHGGSLTLANRPQGGLVASLRLPLDPR